jgi:redox-sensitive bicupin YhaK (pirin superfamily)
MVGADISFHDSTNIVLPLNREHEHALYVFQGGVSLDGSQLNTDTLHYIVPGREELAISGSSEARLLLIGGRPFGEPILMWWNFVARTAEEIAQAREDWMQHRRFGDVQAYNGPRLSAPDLMKFAPPNPAS